MHVTTIVERQAAHEETSYTLRIAIAASAFAEAKTLEFKAISKRVRRGKFEVELTVMGSTILLAPMSSAPDAADAAATAVVALQTAVLQGMLFKAEESLADEMESASEILSRWAVIAREAGL